MAKEAYSYIWQKRPIHMAKEAYSYGKRGLFIWQKRPIHMAEEAHGHTVLQDLPRRGGTTVHMAKEACSYDTRGVFIWQKRRIHTAKEGALQREEETHVTCRDAEHVCSHAYGKRGLFI